MLSASRLLCALLIAAPAMVLGAEAVRLDRAPINERDLVSLQRGAQAYVNYCLGCHSLDYMRYNRLTDLGLNERQIEDNLILTGARIGDLMHTAMDARDAREWFGVAAPDLSVIARAHSSHAGSGADWLYTYLRGCYLDPARPSGWNNTVYENVGMPHVLWQLQGFQVLETGERELPDGSKQRVERLVLEKPGTLTPLEYDRLAADLVNFMVYVSEPAKRARVQIGLYVLLFLGVLWGLAYALKKEYWKDVH
jgi:ubiquinol-cytochrome c reductase cytochrome c1 subunit